MAERKGEVHNSVRANFWEIETAVDRFIYAINVATQTHTIEQPPLQ